MIKYLVCAAMCLMASCVNAQDLYYNYGGVSYCPPVYNYGNYYNYNYQPRVVGYAPIVQWIPQGTYLNVGPAIVTPDRRRVILGINSGFYSINGVDTYYLYGR